MKRTVLLACLVVGCPAGAAAAQEFPRPTEQGLAAVDALIRHAIDSGGLRRNTDANSGATVLEKGDPARLEETLAAHRAELTPAVHEALVARASASGPAEAPALVAPLHSMGVAAGDGIAEAYATYFDGDREPSRNLATAIERFDEADRKSSYFY
jgi:hypothetical protein